MTEELATDIAKRLVNDLYRWRERESWLKDVNYLITLLLEEWPVTEATTFLEFINHGKERRND